MPKVYCTIGNCHYWAPGKGCDASEILITSDEIGSSEPDSVDAPVVQTLANTPVDTCMATCCKTFVSKTSEKKHADDVAIRRS